MSNLFLVLCGVGAEWNLGCRAGYVGKSVSARVRPLWPGG